MLLPSCAYFMDLISMKVYDIKRLSKALAYQPIMIFKVYNHFYSLYSVYITPNNKFNTTNLLQGLKCFLNPTNTVMKIDFTKLKVRYIL